MEPALRLTVGASNVTTTRATLRTVSGIYKDNPDASGLSLVLNELLELEERPVVQFAALLPTGLDSLSNIRQILHCNGAARREGFNQALADSMVLVKLKPFFSSAEFLEVSFCRSTAFSLKLSFEPKRLPRVLFDMLSVKEFIVAGDRNTIDTDIDANHFTGGSNDYVGQGDDQVHPEGAIRIEDQITAVDAGRLVQERPEVFGQREGDIEPPAGGREADLTVVKEDPAGAIVIANGLGTVCLGARDLLALLPAGEGGLNSLAGFLPGGDHQLGRKGWMYGPKVEIGFVVEGDAVDNLQFPSNTGNCIEAGRIMPDGIQQDIFLSVVGEKFKL